MKVFVNGLKMDSYFRSQKKKNSYRLVLLLKYMFKKWAIEIKNKKTNKHLIERKENAGLYRTDRNADLDVSK